MRSSCRLVDDAIDDLEVEELWRRDAETRGCLLRLRSVLPEDRCAAFRRDDGVRPVLEDVHTVRDAERERPAAPSLTEDCRDDRHGSARHRRETRTDRLALTAL